MRLVLGPTLPADDPDELLGALYTSVGRSPHADRPWVMLNMIATADGATAADGVSGGLGGPGDRAVFGAIRSAPDTILVGAATVRAENYGPPRSGARLAIVTGRLDLPTDHRVFSDPANRPLIVTSANAPSAERDRLAAVADFVIAGNERVDLRRALEELRSLGATIVLAEGGPSLNGQLVAGGLIDELCLSLAPLLAGGSSKRVATGPDGGLTPENYRLVHILEDESYLFLRYVRS